MIPSAFFHAAVLSLVLPLAQGYWLPETLKRSAANSCVVPKNSTGGDDSPAFISTVKSCGPGSIIEFSAKETYYLMTPVVLNKLSNVEIIINGNVSLPPNVSYVESVVGNSNLYTGRWVKITGSGVTISGSQDPNSGWLIGHGEEWWPRPNNSNNLLRPHFLSLQVTGLRLRDLKVHNPVGWVFSLGGNDIHMTNTLLDARSNDPNAFPINTDGIDLSGSNVVIDGWKSWNGDDVINVSPPARNVTMRNIVAYGTHGIACSCSDGDGGDYLFENAEIHDSLIGARFKSAVGKTCNITNITWRNFKITNTAYPIHFTQEYVDQEKGIPPGTDTSVASYTSGFKWENIEATTSKELTDGSCLSDPCWSHTEGETNQKGMYIMCKDAAHCSGFQFSNIVLTGANGKPGEMQCTGLNGVEGMGIPCTNGTLS